jgi:hypothetical protein
VKRADEEFCREQFNAFVGNFFDSSAIEWECVQHDPPDYRLILDGIRFAVEVTTLLERVPVGIASPLPRREITTYLKRFVKDIEATVMAEGSLQGKYLVGFATPIDNFAAVQDSIRDRLIEYIHRTSTLDAAPWETVFHRSVPRKMSQSCAIQKVDNKRNQILLGPPGWAKWEDMAVADNCRLLDEILDAKADKLKDITDPWILLLLNRDIFADPHRLKECIPQLSALQSFHTLFVLQPGQQGFVLHSRNNDWRDF